MICLPVCLDNRHLFSLHTPFHDKGGSRFTSHRICASAFKYTPHAGSGSNDSICALYRDQYTGSCSMSIGYRCSSLVDSSCRRYVSLTSSVSFYPSRIFSWVILFIRMTRMVSPP